MKAIKLARKRKSDKSGKVAEDFFNKYTNWRSSDSSLPFNASVQMKSSFSAKKIGNDQGNATDSPQPSSNILTSQYSTQSPSQLQIEERKQQSTSNTRQRLGIQPSDHANSSYWDKEKENNLSQPPSMGTFGIDRDTATLNQDTEDQATNPLFNQLSQALENPDEAIRQPPKTEQNHGPSIITNEDGETDIDLLSDRISSLLKEVDDIKATKVISESQKDYSKPSDQETQKSQETQKILENKQAEEELISQPVSGISDGSTRQTLTPTNDDEFPSINTLREKISEVMSKTDHILEEKETVSTEVEIDREKSSKHIKKEIHSSKIIVGKNHSDILQTSYSSHSKLDKEKLDSVLGLLQDKPTEIKDSTQEQKSSIENIIDYQNFETPSERKIIEVDISFSRTIEVNKYDRSINVIFKYNNRSKDVTKETYKISDLLPIDSTDDTESIEIKNMEKTKVKTRNLILEQPIKEWKLSTGIYEDT